MRITILVASLAICGCAVQKTLIPTGGSRADGTVEMSYEFGEFETPKVDMQQGVVEASKRCQAWGYSDAEPFGGSKSQCQQLGGMSGCVRRLVTMQYQCIGAKKPE